MINISYQVQKGYISYSNENDKFFQCAIMNVKKIKQEPHGGNVLDISTCSCRLILVIVDEYINNPRVTQRIYFKSWKHKSLKSLHNMVILMSSLERKFEPFGELGRSTFISLSNAFI